MDFNRIEENLSETTEEQEPDGNDATKVVPVTESIRYRRRAQSAEKKSESLVEQLAEANQKIAQMSQDLSDLQIEQKLARTLVAAGALDLEAAVLVAKTRMEGKPEAEMDACIEQLKREKAYLFRGSTETTTFRKTAGAKDRVKQTQTALEQAAKKAARTGTRADLQHYLKLRRNLL
jgi:K+/H+ antiporter YhaU regulatory subunit KhtT